MGNDENFRKKVRLSRKRHHERDDNQSKRRRHADEYDDEHAYEYDDEHADEYDDEHADEYDDEHADEYDDESEHREEQSLPSEKFNDVQSLISSIKDKMLDHPNKKGGRKYFKSFKVHYANIQGLAGNKEGVKYHLETKKPHLLFLTETQLNPNSNMTKYDYPGYKFEHKLKVKAGVCVYIREDVCYERLTGIENEDLNIIFIQVDHGIETGCYAGIYRAHYSNLKENKLKNEKINETFEYLYDKVEHIKNKTETLLLGGDFNAHHKDWLVPKTHTDYTGKKTFAFAQSLNLTQMVNEITRIPHQSTHEPSCLDLILTNQPDNHQVKVSAPLGTSDHCLVEDRNTFPTVYDYPKYLRRYWDFAAAEWNKMNAYLKNRPWNQCFDLNDPNYCANAISDIIQEAMDLFIPYSLVSKFKYSVDCIQAENAKQEAYEEYKKNLCEEKRKAYKAVAKISKQVFTTKSNSAFETAIPSLPQFKKPDGTLTDNTAEKVNLLAPIFASRTHCYTSDGQPLPEVRKADFSKFKIKITATDVEAVIQRLDEDIQYAPDSVPPIVLKKCSSFLSIVLAKLYNLCYNQGVFPKSWKRDHIQPAYFDGACDEPTNYARITIKNTFTEVFERMLGEKLTLFINDETGMKFFVSNESSVKDESYLLANELNTMKASGLPNIFVDVSQNFQNDRALRVISDGIASKNIPIQKGLPLKSDFTLALLPLLMPAIVFSLARFILVCILILILALAIFLVKTYESFIKDFKILLRLISTYFNNSPKGHDSISLYCYPVK